MKWLYIKNGDAVMQLKRLSNDEASRPEAGPDAFLADFLYGIKEQPTLLLSWCTHNDEFVVGDRRARTYRVSGSSFKRLGNVALRFAATISSLLEMLRFKPQRIICGRVGPMLWMTAIVSSWLKCPFIHSRHNSLFEEQARWYHRALAQLDIYAIRKAHAVICHGPFLAEQMQTLGVDAEKIVEFDVGFEDFQKLANTSMNSSSAPNEKCILFVGRVDRTKGVFDLLHASEALIRNDPDIVLKYVGDGSGLEELKQAVKQSSVATRVECLGKLGHAELPQLVNSSYVMVTPTLREFPEGRCMAVMEALACSIPVVAPDYGPFPYLVKSEINGLLYEADNVDELSKALGRMFNEKGLYQQVKKGAEITAIDIKKPVRTFYEAVDYAFSI